MNSTDPQEILERLRPAFGSLEAQRLTLLAKRKTGTLWMLGLVAIGILLAVLLAPNGGFAPLIVLFAPP